MVRFPLGKWLCSAEIWLYKEIDDINWERGKGNQLATSVQREGNYSFEAVKVAWFRIYSEEWADRSLLNWMMLSKKTRKTGFSPEQLVRGDCHLLRCKRVWEELLLNSGWRQEEEERSWFFEKSLLSEVGHVSECGPYVWMRLVSGRPLCPLLRLVWWQDSISWFHPIRQSPQSQGGSPQLVICQYHKYSRMPSSFHSLIYSLACQCICTEHNV